MVFLKEIHMQQQPYIKLEQLESEFQVVRQSHSNKSPKDQLIEGHFPTKILAHADLRLKFE